jgi:hypothetical protein
METPTRGYSTSISSLYIDWIALTGDDTGSAEIDSYNLQWDNGTGGITWSDLIGADPYSTATSGIFTENVVEATYYQVRVRAHNAHGWSEWSDILTTKAAGRPETPLPPTTEINNENIRVSWIDPVSNS